MSSTLTRAIGRLRLEAIQPHKCGHYEPMPLTLDRFKPSAETR